MFASQVYATAKGHISTSSISYVGGSIYVYVAGCTHTECAFVYMSIVCMYTCEARGKNWLSSNESQSYFLK